MPNCEGSEVICSRIPFFRDFKLRSCIGLGSYRESKALRYKMEVGKDRTVHEIFGEALFQQIQFQFPLGRSNVFFSVIYMASKGEVHDHKRRARHDL